MRPSTDGNDDEDDVLSDVGVIEVSVCAVPKLKGLLDAEGYSKDKMMKRTNQPAEEESKVGRPLLLELASSRSGREVVFANGWPPEIVYSSWTASLRNLQVMSQPHPWFCSSRSRQNILTPGSIIFLAANASVCEEICQVVPEVSAS